VLKAITEMRRMQREAAAIAEEPVARFQWRYFNGHRSEGTPEMPVEQFRCFLTDAAPQGSGGLSGKAAAAVMALANAGQCPPYVLPAWGEVMATVNRQPVDAPECRLLQTEDGQLSVIAPQFLEVGIRGGLVAAGEEISGEVVLSDVDRPLLTWRVIVPERKGSGWIEAEMLLLTAT
jgi:hypothetical protein